VHLTKAKLFKKYNYPSWKMCEHGNMGITIKKDNQVTNFDKHFKACVKAGLEGTGYILHRYKKADGIKKTVVGKTYANYLNANDKKYYGMTGKQYYNFTENDTGYQNALAFDTSKKFQKILNQMEAA
tara:strand:+ start:219 stop:599 length:381 start_codon:yes stop_codon:yes gene_type:complete